MSEGDKSLFRGPIYTPCRYVLMQFNSLEEFQQEFQDINQEEQVGRLHKMLAPHLLRSKLTCVT